MASHLFPVPEVFQERQNQPTKCADKDEHVNSCILLRDHSPLINRAELFEAGLAVILGYSWWVVMVTNR